MESAKRKCREREEIMHFRLLEMILNIEYRDVVVHTERKERFKSFASNRSRSKRRKKKKNDNNDYGDHDDDVDKTETVLKENGSIRKTVRR